MSLVINQAAKESANWRLRHINREDYGLSDDEGEQIEEQKTIGFK